MDNAISQRVTGWGITIVTFTGDHSDEYVFSEYTKCEVVQNMFISSRTLTRGYPVNVHGIDALRGEEVRDSHFSYH